MTLVDKGDLAMFQLRPIYTNGPRGPIPDLRYAALNLDDKTAARIAKYAKAVATVEHKGDRDGVEKRRAALLGQIRGLGTGPVNILSVMYMIRHPDIRALATGAGLTEDDIDQIVQHSDLSGRDIKQTLKLAALWSASNGETITPAAIDFVKGFLPTRRAAL